MICTRLFAVGILAAMPVVGWSYDSAFTLTFEQASDTEGWADQANPANTEIFAGENEAEDNPPYATPPEDATNYNGTNWLRLGARNQSVGVGTYTYDGRAGGTTDVATDFVATADVYINPDTTHRFQVALFGRWQSSTGTAPFELFYSHNTPSQPDGFGWRHGVTQTYNGLPGATIEDPQWVRMRIQMIEATAVLSVDVDMDGEYDHTSPELELASTVQPPGRIGFQIVINDPNNGHAAVPDRFAYFDNLTYTPVASVPEWSLY